ncbi:ABC transporter substrate-binding protein [Bradyrhizobium mercantei]|uniref:ABC transporter substrate-binding protein n=1 Tax=Bradyrhizobium mercantei TaxID=1904807 RepID=UPI000976A779|nr:ABC transporter substrate-binding protein [Bradyrhizobium mercantei]
MMDSGRKGLDARVASLTRRETMRGVAVAGLAVLAAPAFTGRAMAAKPIRIGFVSPQTGPIAAFGSADDFVVSEIRKVIGGGISIGGIKYPIEILVRDSQSNPSRAAEVAAELITKDKVNLMLASSTSDTVNPVADQCELNGVPCITTDTPWEAYFFGRGGEPAKGFDWTYHFFWGGSQVVQTFTGLWNSIETNKVVGTLWSNDPDGVALSDPNKGLPPAFAKAGFKVVDTGLFTPLSNDFSARIAKLKSAQAEIVTGVFLPPDFATFWAQCGQQGYRPKAVTAAKALLFPASVEALGERGAGLSSEEWWSPDHPFKSGLTGQSASELCDAFTKATGKQWVQPIGFKHAVLEVALDVLKRTKQVEDPKSILDAIAATDYQSIVGPVSWKKGPVKNVSTTPLVGGQWVRGDKFKYEIKIVNNSAYPDIKTVKKFEPIAY